MFKEIWVLRPKIKSICRGSSFYIQNVDYGWTSWYNYHRNVNQSFDYTKISFNLSHKKFSIWAKGINFSVVWMFCPSFTSYTGTQSIIGHSTFKLSYNESSSSLYFLNSRKWQNFCTELTYFQLFSFFFFPACLNNQPSM